MRFTIHRQFPTTMTVVGVAAAMACGSPTDSDAAWTLRAVSGDGQTGTVGDTLQPIVVQVLRETGFPAIEVAVDFTVTDGNAFIENGAGNARGAGEGATVTQITNVDGEAFVTFALGLEPRTYGLRASIARPGDSVLDLRAFAVPGPPEQIVRAGDGQVGPAGAELPAPVGLIVADRFGNPIARHLVTWTVASGGGSVSEDSVMTGETGAAYVRWMLGSVPGSQTVTGSVDSVGTFLLTATAQ